MVVGRANMFSREGEDDKGGFINKWRVAETRLNVAWLILVW